MALDGYLDFPLFVGTPTANGEYAVNNVTFSWTSSALSVTYSVAATLPNLTLSISPALQLARTRALTSRGAFYSTSSHSIAGGKAPLTPMLVSGSLPEGMVLDNETSQIEVQHACL